MKESFLYDSLGRLIEQRGESHGMVDRVTYKYNAQGQLEEKKIFSYTQHLEKQLTFTYDEQGKLIKIATIEMLDELPHDHGAHYFPEMAFYSSDTILYDFENLQISIQHREANRYLALTTEDAPIVTAFTNVFKFDASGRILSRKFEDKNRNIHFTDQFTACWSFVNNKQYRNLFLDTCQLEKRVNHSPDVILNGYTSVDTFFYLGNHPAPAIAISGSTILDSLYYDRERFPDYFRYTYHYTESGTMQFLGSSGDSATQKIVLTFDTNGSLVSRETYISQHDTIISSYQVSYDQVGRIIQEISFTSANWQRQFSFEPVMSSIPPPPVDKHQTTTYSYYESGIPKCVKKTFQNGSHSSCEETFVEYY
ncbi:MAG: hypothetical protein IPG07_05520 [Crocinitomicaceae bacterium]|nr:hypothetical protein [Crocinitomicaceae bacterium]